MELIGTEVSCIGRLLTLPLSGGGDEKVDDTSVVQRDFNVYKADCSACSSGTHQLSNLKFRHRHTKKSSWKLTLFELVYSALFLRDRL